MPSTDSDDATVPILESSEDFSQALPEINIQAIMLKFKGDDSIDFSGSTKIHTDILFVLFQYNNSHNCLIVIIVSDNSYWKVNFDRSHQDFRDDLLVTAMTRSLDECGIYN